MYYSGGTADYTNSVTNFEFFDRRSDFDDCSGAFVTCGARERCARDSGGNLTVGMTEIRRRLLRAYRIRGDIPWRKDFVDFIGFVELELGQILDGDETLWEKTVPRPHGPPASFQGLLGPF